MSTILRDAVAVFFYAEGDVFAVGELVRALGDDQEIKAHTLVHVDKAGHVVDAVGVEAVAGEHHFFVVVFYVVEAAAEGYAVIGSDLDLLHREAVKPGQGFTFLAVIPDVAFFGLRVELFVGVRVLPQERICEYFEHDSGKGTAGCCEDRQYCYNFAKKGFFFFHSGFPFPRFVLKCLRRIIDAAVNIILYDVG